MPRPRRAITLVFSSLCAANILAGLFPPGSATGDTLAGALAPARWTTGTWQRWEMFHSIPTLRHMEMHIVARDAGGGERIFGPLLPGFGEFEVEGEKRPYYLFTRMEFDPPDPTGAEYLRRVGEALRAEDPELVEFSVVADLGYIRHLAHIRKDGTLAKRVTETFGPYPLRDEGGR